MKKDNKKTQTFISRMPTQMHKELRFISMYTGMSMQDIGNYAIQKEIELFKKQIPALQDMSNEYKKRNSNTINSNTVFTQDQFVKLCNENKFENDVIFFDEASEHLSSDKFNKLEKVNIEKLKQVFNDMKNEKYPYINFKEEPSLEEDNTDNIDKTD